MRLMMVTAAVAALLLAPSMRAVEGQDYKGTPFTDRVRPTAPQPVPGLVHCAYYDRGGEGVAYHDSDAKNNGSGALNPADGSYLHEFRKDEGVDISYTKTQNATDTSPYNKVRPEANLLYVGWTEPGEWFNVTVDVKEAGRYVIDLLYTSNRGGSISIDRNGRELTKTIEVPTTFDARDPVAWRQWHHWNLLKDAASFDLPAGPSVLTIHTRTGGNMNYATIDFRRAPSAAARADSPSFEKFFPARDLTTVGVYYYPEHWDPAQWERDFKNMAAMGFEFTHFAEFAWAQLEPEEGKYDFEWLDRALALAAKYRLKVIMCTSTATPPVWLVRKYPEVLATGEDGRQMDHGSRQHATFSSAFYRQYSLKMVEQLARRYGGDARVIGWQLDNEPRRFIDYGKDAPGRFRQWLKDKYAGSIDTLNRAWGNAFWSGTYSDFSQIDIPLHRQWGMNLHQRLDHYRFADAETATFLDEQAQVIRKHITGTQWVTSNYIPMYDVGYIGASRELDFASYTRYMVYGGDRGIGPRGYRVGEYTRIAMANDFFRPLQGMYGVMELQPGQVNWGSVNPQPLPGAVRLWLWHVFAGGSKFACTYRYRAPLYGYEAYHYGIVGTDGVTPTPGGKEYAQFIGEIRQLRSKAEPAARVPAAYARRTTGILIDTDSIQAIALNRQTTEWNTEAHILKYYRALKSFGAPVDFIRDSADFDRYPVLIVPAYQMIDEALVARLTRYVEQGGTLVLTCRTGLQNRSGHLWEAKFYQPIWALIGAEIQSYDLPMAHAPNVVRFGTQDHEWSSWGDLLAPRPGTDTWATHQGDFYAGTPAVVSRKLGKGTVTWVGVDTRSGALEQQVLTKLFEQRGIGIERYPEGVLVEYRDGLGVAMNYSDKDYNLALPAGAEVLIGNATLKTAGVLVWKVAQPQGPQGGSR